MSTHTYVHIQMYMYCICLLYTSTRKLKMSYTPCAHMCTYIILHQLTHAHTHTHSKQYIIPSLRSIPIHIEVSDLTLPTSAKELLDSFEVETVENALVTFTTGSTGMPKLMLRRHRCVCVCMCVSECVCMYVCE